MTAGTARILLSYLIATVLESLKGENAYSSGHHGIPGHKFQLGGHSVPPTSGACLRRVPNNQGFPELPQPHLHHPLYVTDIQDGTVPLHLTSQFSLIYLLSFYLVVLHSSTILLLPPKAHTSLPQPPVSYPHLPQP